MNVLINYADPVFYDAQKLNTSSGREVGGFDEVIQYCPKDIDRKFYRQNEHIFFYTRGAGYWLWKPYLIKKTLERLAPNDYLFYSDAGAYFIAPVTPLIQTAENIGQDIFVFELQGLFEKEYTKRDAFILMNCDSESYTETLQRLATFSLWKNTPYALEFVSEWLEYAQDERILTDLDNQLGCSNYPGFIEHRHDQSIFSLLSKKYTLAAHRDPVSIGTELKQRHPRSTYPPLLTLTRKRSPLPFHVKVQRRIRRLCFGRIHNNKNQG